MKLNVYNFHMKRGSCTPFTASSTLLKVTIILLIDLRDNLEDTDCKIYNIKPMLFSQNQRIWQSVL